jgi:Domain of unknown function (DUF4440)
MNRWKAAGLSAALACLVSPPLPAATALAVSLKQATQALMDATAPGERAVWAHYTDERFVYVTEDNEVKGRAEVLEDLKPLPAGYAGWINVEAFECHDFGSFAVTTYIIDEHEIIEGQTLHARYRSSDTWHPTPAGWRLASSQVFAIQQDPPRSSESGAQLAQFEGLYALGSSARQNIRSAGDHLLAERSGGAAQLLLPESGDVFFTPGRPRTRRVFTRDPQGKVTGFADRREGADLLWTRIAPEAQSH